ncbi:Tim44 domain-containing protein [Aquabacter spiritensis]|uniref:Putative lipid-binding transport protein (Tim44 family) n=1 Tax=Aquabacter spiritensis TaxID=933073 RepID=A0A4V2UY05_9HYPH|nr:TIM44-like domain-containing protein [Aquabacter spiritensis]TCT05548.1 putative lipid-binding transport protein (Tim44 family) [Aquabacter spiritensis]
MNLFKRLAGLAGVVMLGAVMSLAVVGDADARKGGGFGSRGARTWTAPPATNTAPTTAQPLQRSTTPAPGPQSSAAAANGARGGLFGGGLGGSLMRGLAIGGLVGLLLGHGLGGLAGMFGLLLQVALIGGIAYLAYRFFVARRQPAAAGAGAPYSANRGMFDGAGSTPSPAPQTAPRSALGGFGGGNGAGTPAPDAAPDAGPAAAPVYQRAPNRRVRDEIGLQQQDFEAFEARLTGIQDAFSREDRAALSRLTTPEVLAGLSEELDANEAKGVRNEVRDVKLLQGDLAEAWREDARDYATVALRYEMRDTLRDRATGALTPGSTDAPEELTEVWTFVRPRGGEWVLSAIQDV